MGFAFALAALLAAVPGSGEARLSLERSESESSGTSLSLPEQSRWYGRQLMVADSASLGLLLTVTVVAWHDALACGFLAPCPVSAHATATYNGLVLLSLGGATLLPPLIHIWHGRYLEAGLSFGLRAVIPGLLALLTGNAFVVALAFVFGAIIDDTKLSWEPVLEGSEASATAGDSGHAEPQPSGAFRAGFMIAPGGGVSASLAARW
jgi:hypothetical protein